MKGISSLADLDQAIREGNEIFYGEMGEKSFPITLEQLMKKPLGSIMKAITGRRLTCEDDPQGAETLVIRKFKDRDEIHEWMRNTDMKELEKELYGKYGPCTGYVDPQELQFCITRRIKKD